MSHFNATGFALSDPGELEEMIMQAEARAEEAGSVVEHKDGRTARYVDPSGASSHRALRPGRVARVRAARL